jgi:hypothetical protein
VRAVFKITIDGVTDVRRLPGFYFIALPAAVLTLLWFFEADVNNTAHGEIEKRNQHNY